MFLPAEHQLSIVQFLKQWLDMILLKNLFQILEILNLFSAVGVGPGIRHQQLKHRRPCINCLLECKKPVIIDADALNILSVNKEWLHLLPAGTILTPHPKEFERLAGRTENGFDRLERQIEFSKEHKCIVILKGAYTSITT